MEEWSFPDWGEAFQEEYEEAAQAASSVLETDETEPDCEIAIPARP